MERDTTEKGGNPTTLTIADRFARLHNFVDAGFNRLYDQLDRIEGKIDKMATGQDQLDADLQAEAQAESDLGAAITAEIAALTAALAKEAPHVDLTNEDSQVMQSINTLKAFGTQLQASIPTP